MRISDDLDRWGTNNRDFGLLLLRIVLGGVLILKAFRFLFHTDELTKVINVYHATPFAYAFTWIIILATMVGGLFIIIGVITRITCVVQIPILLGAILINVQTSLSNSSEWMLAFVTFFLLVYLYIFGSGKFSLSYLLLKQPADDAREDEQVYGHHHHHA